MPKTVMELTKVDIYLNQSQRAWAYINGKNEVWVTGSAFIDSRFCQNEDIARLFSEVEQFYPKKYIEKANQLNGTFAVIVRSDSGFFAMVDRIRSIPLFFTQIKNHIYISDDARSVLRYMGPSQIDEMLRQEFLLTGYITGSETLFNGLEQLQAGECIWSEFMAGRGIELLKHRYFKYYSDSIFDYSDEKLVRILDSILLRTFERLVISAKDRTLVVPLSGGLDSRLVAAMLKRVGHKNVVCISYGSASSKDVSKSKEVAEQLEFRWEYLPYTRAKWYGWYRTKEWKAYCNFADGLTSLPHIDEWPAIWELKEKGTIPQDSILVPGHTGDFISGGHLIYLFDFPGRKGYQGLIDSIIRKHYGLWPDLLSNEQIRKAMEYRIRENLCSLAVSNQQELTSAYEYWEWQERQAKFILNSVRVYDFWGYHWRLPLWDVEIMKFWSHVPYNRKLNKMLYKLYLRTKDFYGVFKKDLIKQQKSIDSTEKNCAKRDHLIFNCLSFLIKIRNEYRRRYLEYFMDPKATLGIYDYITITFVNRKRRNINSILVKDYLKDLDNISGQG